MYGRPGGQVIAGIIEIAQERGAQAFIEDVLQPAARISTTFDNARHSGTPHSASISQYLRYLGWHSFPIGSRWRWLGG